MVRGVRASRQPRATITGIRKPAQKVLQINPGINLHKALIQTAINAADPTARTDQISRVQVGILNPEPFPTKMFIPDPCPGQAKRYSGLSQMGILLFNSLDVLRNLLQILLLLLLDQTITRAQCNEVQILVAASFDTLILCRVHSAQSTSAL